MKRSPWLSSLMFVGLALLMAGAFAVGVRAMQAAHNHCLNGCGIDPKTKKKLTPDADNCCQPPPCEYEYDLKVTVAKVRSFAQSRKQVSGPGQTPVKQLNLGPHASGQVALKLSNMLGIPPALLYLKGSVLEELAKDFAPCINKKPFIKEQPFAVDYNSPLCTLTQVGMGGKIDPNDPAALEKAKDAASQCREAVEADWHRATTLQAICLKNKGLNATTLPDAEQKAAEAAQRSMQEQLSQFLDSCKPFAAKFKSARDAVKKAEQMLKDSGGKHIPQNQRKLSGLSKKQVGSGSEQ